MKNIIFTLVLMLVVSTSFAKDIEATVIFQNLTEKELKEGVLFIAETNQKIKITKEKSFKIKLPKKGKYQISFTSKGYAAVTTYSKRGIKNKSKIIIYLMNKNTLNDDGIYSFPMVLDTNLTDKQLEQKIKEGALHFIMPGIDDSIPEEYIKFKEKYKIGLIKQNCIADPLSFKKATENNQMISNYLTKKYGKDWYKELPAKPFGVK